MPELPDILLYLHALRPRVVGQRVSGVRLVSAFLLRSIDPPLASVEGRIVTDLHRLGKRVVFELERELFLVFHLMIAGRFRWKPAGASVPGKVGLMALDFDTGTLIMTEAGTKRQASLYVVQGCEALERHNPGGLEVLNIDLATFVEALHRENHTLKRALTDPHLFSGIGNAYSDEILHAARLSPFKQTAALTSEEAARVFDATRSVLSSWIDRLQSETGTEFPEKVTAFREGMAVHGRYGKPCPVCGSTVQRIAYASNEANYCVTCQTGGRLLADRSLSRLLREDWPRTLEELERRRGRIGDC
ncbi:MAG TPA: DNA-formamidopyrimidine glycosylase family protein [Vicinamibacterales bacterium]|nr:DNA-formamidopyrimidine glycosylase family protein [Vicinamibacterales bacterium]